MTTDGTLLEYLSEVIKMARYWIGDTQGLGAVDRARLDEIEQLVWLRLGGRS